MDGERCRTTGSLAVKATPPAVVANVLVVVIVAAVAVAAAAVDAQSRNTRARSHMHISRPRTLSQLLASL